MNIFYRWQLIFVKESMTKLKKYFYQVSTQDFEKIPNSNLGENVGQNKLKASDYD